MVWFDYGSSIYWFFFKGLFIIQSWVFIKNIQKWKKVFSKPLSLSLFKKLSEKYLKAALKRSMEIFISSFLFDCHTNFSIFVIQILTKIFPCDTYLKQKGPEKIEWIWGNKFIQRNETSVANKKHFTINSFVLPHNSKMLLESLKFY